MQKKLTASRLMIGISEQQSDLLYATGFMAPDEVVYVHNRKQGFLVVNGMELNRARKTCPHLRVLSPVDLGLPPRSRPATWAMALLRQQKIPSCMVPDWLPLALAREVEAAGVKLKTDAGELLRERAVKSEHERGLMRRAQRAAVSALRLAVERIDQARVGRNHVLELEGAVLTSDRLRGLIDAHLMGLGFVNPAQNIVACGRHAYDPHEVGSGPLYAHRPIVLDIFPRSRKTGYWGDLTRTVVKGKPDPALLRLHRAVLAAHDLALAMVRPGVTGREIHQAVVAYFGQEGYPTRERNGCAEGFIHGTGHGVGLDVHELPRVNTAGDVPLEAGHVITIEPGLYYRRLGGVRIEDLVEVTEQGGRIMARAPYRFVLA